MNIEDEVEYLSTGRPPNNADLIMPYFVFERLPHIEQEAGWALAGTLYVDLPKREQKKANREPPTRVKSIIKQLCELAKNGSGSGPTFNQQLEYAAMPIAQIEKGIRDKYLFSLGALRARAWLRNSRHPAIGAHSTKKSKLI
jgi:hypothetical protein